jgi:hypothetical protein
LATDGSTPKADTARKEEAIKTRDVNFMISIDTDRKKYG